MPRRWELQVWRDSGQSLDGLADHGRGARARGGRSSRRIEARRAARRCACARAPRHRDGAARRSRSGEGAPAQRRACLRSREAVARARCVVAEAEVALASRDPGLAGEGARRSAGDARAPWRSGQRRARAVSGDPAPAPDRARRRGRAHARRARPRAFPACVEDRPRARGCGDRDAASPCKDGARRARPGRRRRAPRRHPRADGGGRKRSARPERARGAPRLRVARSESSCSTRSKRCWRRRRWSWTPAVASCVTHGTVISLATRPVLLTLARALGEAWPGDVREGRARRARIPGEARR